MEEDHDRVVVVAVAHTTLLVTDRMGVATIIQVVVVVLTVTLKAVLYSVGYYF